MNSKEAIDLLTPLVSFDGYENIYKYKAIKDSDQEQLKELLQQQDKMLEKACLMIAEHEDCPLDATGVRKYLQSEVGK